MRSSLVKVLSIVLLSQLIFSCQPADKKSAKVSITATDKMSADELASSAEQLITPYSFMLAYKLAKLAVDKEPNNVRALFYYKFLKRYEAFRGFYSRVSSALTPAQQDELKKEIALYPPSPLKDFLTEKGTDIKTIKDEQDVLAQYYGSIAEFYDFLKDKENSDFQARINISKQEFRKDQAGICNATDTGSELKIQCDTTNMVSVKLNMADMILLRQITAGELLVGIAYNSYNLDGLDKLATAPAKMTLQQSIDTAFSNEKFGLLRNDHMFGSLLKIGADMGAAANWALKYQATLCPHGAGAIDNRPGYLFKNGICFAGKQDDATHALHVLDLALKGPTLIDITPDIKGSNVDVFAWSRNAIKDLRTVQPSQYDGGGKAISLRDNTVGGVLLDSNAPKVLLNQ